MFTSRQKFMFICFWLLGRRLLQTFMFIPFQETAKLFFKVIVPFTFPPEACEMQLQFRGGARVRVPLCGQGRLCFERTGGFEWTTGPKERAPRLSYQLVQVWSRREEGVVRVKSCKQSHSKGIELDCCYHSPLMFDG